MKQLQNNFTSPEQSKRLLELGLPADSADCYYEAIGFNQGYEHTPQICTNGKFRINIIDLPCWSVGRLIEITTICREWFEGQKYHSFVFQKDISPLEKIIEKIETAARMNQLDFSKLED